MYSPSRNVAMLALALGAIAFSSDAMAQSKAETTSTPPKSATPQFSAFEKPAIRILDVALTKDGFVRGRVLSTDGKPLDGAQVVIRRDEELLQKLLTNKQGEFSAEGLRPGVYTIATIHGGGLYRLWPKQIAPPSARTQALLVAQRPVIRAQLGDPATLVSWASIGVGVAGLAVGVVAIDEVNDLEDDVKALRSP